MYRKVRYIGRFVVSGGLLYREVRSIGRFVILEDSFYWEVPYTYSLYLLTLTEIAPNIGRFIISEECKA